MKVVPYHRSTHADGSEISSLERVLNSYRSVYSVFYCYLAQKCPVGIVRPPSQTAYLDLVLPRNPEFSDTRLQYES